MRKVYFYPHSYLRDRQLETIRQWSLSEVVNPEIASNRVGNQVNKNNAIANKINFSWKQKLPLLNIKWPPERLDKDTVLYVWGGLTFKGLFITELDNPWSLVGYNIKAMKLYSLLIKKILQSERCVQINCMSQACRESLKILFGNEIYNKSKLIYPSLNIKEINTDDNLKKTTNFLFVGTQFDLKGGKALIKSFSRAYKKNPNISLDIVTHLPSNFPGDYDGIRFFPATYNKEEIYKKFMYKSDILIHPTYVDTFGVVVLEAIAHGLGIISTDLYALPEMVYDGVNGIILNAPISIWDGYIPSKHYKNLSNIKEYINNFETYSFESELEKSILKFSENISFRKKAKKASRKIYLEKFQC